MKLIKAVCTMLLAQAAVTHLYADTQTPVPMSSLPGPWGQPVASVELAQQDRTSVG